MAIDPIGARGASVRGATVSLLTLRGESGSPDVNCYSVWDVAHMHKGFQAATSQSVRKGVKSMDESIEMAEGWATELSEHLSEMEMVEVESVVQIRRLIAELKDHRDDFASGGGSF